jgi:GT2 family glycosyltransferase
MRACDFVNSLKDSRFSYIRNDHNLGLPGNFQNCVNLAKSDWVVILGQDDSLPPNYVSSLLTHLRASDIGFIQPKVQVVGPDGGKNRNLADTTKTVIRNCIALGQITNWRESEIEVNSSAIIPWFLVGNPFYFPTIVWNRSVLQDFGFNLDLPVTLDYELIFRILNSHFKVLFLRDTTAIYRRHQESASGKMSNMLERLREETRVLKSFKTQSEEFSLIHIFIIWMRPTIRLHALVIAIGQIRSRNFLQGRKFAKEFFKI